MSTLKHHHIRFKKGPDMGEASEWEEEIKQVKGVTKVAVDAVKMDVYVEYDLVKCSEEALEHWMVSKGFVLDNSLTERLKRSWIHFTEDNEQDALHVKGHSCCDVDEIERKRREPK
ncbi:MAG: hypothetical protein ACE5GF_00755 [Thermodesulfobacteriota bacterium]